MDRCGADKKKGGRPTTRGVGGGFKGDRKHAIPGTGRKHGIMGQSFPTLLSTDILEGKDENQPDK